MFEIIKALITGKNKSSNRLNSSTSLGLHELQPIVGRHQANDDHLAVIDTGTVLADNVVTSILEVETVGERTSDTAKFTQRFLGRQAVLDRSQQVIGYELMQRQASDTSGKSQDESLRLLYDEMLLNSVTKLGMNDLMKDKQLVISLSPKSLTHRLLQEIKGKGVMLAVKIGADPGSDLLKNLQQLRMDGFQLILEDYAPFPESAPFLKLVHYIQFHVARFDAISLGKQTVAVLKEGEARLFAKGVDTEEDFEVCRRLGFHLFQGHYFAQPRQPMVHSIDNDRVQVMELLNKVMARAELPELEEGFKHDAMLSYKLLRFMNSAGSNIGVEVRSISHAILILGYEQLYRWLTLLLFTSGKLDQSSQAIMKSALVRARLAELLCLNKMTPAEAEGAFIVGIFSLLDALLNMPMAQALERIQLPAPVLDALLRQEGCYAPFLALAIACEDFDLDRIAKLAVICGLNADAVNTAHVQALMWAEDIER
ncbi:MAG: EAL domain-containing protein [Sulfuricellaceae bacterium]|nr:EAL domain-containing protein [Sulfuricellaceae bacterium]